ncbi:hypothetical protein [Actinokineospora cianjurensis]|uniref:hypothetical protein n=1 Tax=Actinokineospora cianjurensis TaxID=585224 RepID=UPI001476BB55|nr:hypothetical protein [Actinokineospora cianjurensis]
MLSRCEWPGLPVHLLGVANGVRLLQRDLLVGLFGLVVPCWLELLPRLLVCLHLRVRG